MRPIDAVIRLRDQFTPILRSVSAGMQNHIKDHVKMAEQIKKSGSAQMRFGKEVEKTGNAISGFSKKCALLAAPLMGAAAAGLKLGSDLTNGMAKVSTLVDTNVVDMAKLRTEVIELSNKSGVAVSDLAEAQYQAISAGVAAGESVKFLDVATKTAKAGFTDTTTAIDGLTTVINAYGLANEDAMKISDQMMVAQNFGKTTIDQMSRSLGNVIPIAASLDVQTEELFASIAVLTKNGIGTSEAITGLKAAFSNIVKPTKEASEAADHLGIQFTASGLQAKGMQVFITDIKEKLASAAPEYVKLIEHQAQMQAQMQGMKKGSDAYRQLNKESKEVSKSIELMAKAADSPIAGFATMFGSVEALNTMLVLSGKGAADFDIALKMMRDSAGQTEGAYKKMITPSEEAKIAMNQLANAGMELAAGLAPFMKTGTLLIKEFAGWLNSLTEEQKNFLTYAARNVVIFILLGGAIGKTISTVGKGIKVFGEFNKSFKAAGSIGGYIAKEHKQIDGVIKGLGGGMKATEGALKSNLNSMGQSIIAFSKKIASGFRHPIIAAQSMKTGILSSLQSMRGGIGRISANLKGIFTSLSKGIGGVFRSVAQGARFLFMNPIGIAVAVIIGLAYLIYKNWGPIKEFFIKTFTIIGQKTDGVLGKFSMLFDKASVIFNKLVVRVESLWNSFAGGGSVVEQAVQIIGNILGSGFSTAINVAIVVVEGFANTIAAAIDGILQILNGVIDFLTGVFTGNWTLAWQGIVEIFSGVFSGIGGVCEAVLGTVKGTINSVIAGINAMSFDIPEWVPGVGGSRFQLSIPMLAKGTENWQGGAAMIHDRGAEIVDLPRGSRVIPHDRSLQIAKQEGRREAQTVNNNKTIQEGTKQVIIQKIADKIVIGSGSERDMNELLQKLEFTIRKAAANGA